MFQGTFGNNGLGVSYNTAASTNPSPGASPNAGRRTPSKTAPARLEGLDDQDDNALLKVNNAIDDDQHQSSRHFAC